MPKIPKFKCTVQWMHKIILKKIDAQNDCTMPGQITITTAHHSNSSRQQPYLNKLVCTPIEQCLKLEKTHMDFTIKALET